MTKRDPLWELPVLRVLRVSGRAVFKLSHAIEAIAGVVGVLAWRIHGLANTISTRRDIRSLRGHHACASLEEARRKDCEICLSRMP